MPTPIESTLGSLIVAIIIAAMLYGTATTQAYMYWLNYPDDTLLVRCTVLAIWLTETLHSAFCIHLAYSYAVFSFDDFPGILRTVWSVPATVLLGVVIAALVQSFFIHRIWILSRRNVLITFVPSFLLFCRVGLGIATAALASSYGALPKFRAGHGDVAVISTGLSLAVATDLTIAATLLHFLRQNRSGLRATDQLVRTLQAYVINSGSLTMLCSLSVLITFAVLSDNYIFLGLVEIQSKLYANSLLASLNARRYLSSSTRGTQQYSTSTSIRVARSDVEASAARHIEIFKQVSKATDTSLSGGDIPLEDARAAVSATADDDDDDDGDADSRGLSKHPRELI